MALPWVKVALVAVLVSKTRMAPACRPSAAVLATEMLPSKVFRLVLSNPAVPAESRFSARVAPLFTLMLAAVQLPVLPP